MALPVKLDHCVIHVSDWERSNAFYRDVIGAEIVPRGAGFAYRFGDCQLNCHGPGVAAEPVARLPVAPGNSDVCFEWDGPIADAVAHLARAKVPIELADRAQRRQGQRHQCLLPRPRRIADGVPVLSVRPGETAKRRRRPTGSIQQPGFRKGTTAQRLLERQGLWRHRCNLCSCMARFTVHGVGSI
jgi:catechol 2,3-dioxygenase-like lactoylglutathione lyase family enzyme